jgi:hypothetical protein
LFAWCRLPDVGDTEVYLAGAVAILAEYPPAVMTALADPRSGTRLLKDYPSLGDLRRACDAANAPFERELERERAKRSAARLATLAPPRRARTAEEQARAELQVAAVRRQLGIPAQGMPARSSQPRPLPEISGERIARLRADLAARAARNAARINGRG